MATTSVPLDHASCPPEVAKRFDTALDQASVFYHEETYPTAHGWMKPGFPIYGHGQTNRGWIDMFELFART